MATLSPKEEMRQLIKTCIETNDTDTALKCLEIYQSSFGSDDFYLDCISFICPPERISLICICRANQDTELLISRMEKDQNYKNLEFVCISQENFIAEFCEYIATAQSSYICFYDLSHTYEINRIPIFLSFIQNNPAVDGIICARNFTDENGTVIAHPDWIYKERLDNKIFTGKQLLEYCISDSVNLYGDLSTLFLKTDYVKSLSIRQLPIPDSMQTTAFLHQLLYSAKISYSYLPLVSSVLTPAQADCTLANDYQILLQYYKHKKTITSIPDTAPDFTVTEHFIPCSKNITFFYTDMGEYYNLKPLADEANARGYSITFSKDIRQPAEIGIYCQHLCYPENSKFSVILLHDLAQGHNRWPNLWEGERWNHFDIGILPGESWSRRWSQCACQYYANPGCGVYALGYPKSDLISSPELLQRVNELRKKFGLKHEISILYAPSWENDGKEDDFIRACSDLNVNLLIKQAHWPERYAHITENINQMRAMHEGYYDNLYYIEPEESILTALAMCDLVISEESSVMAEALMFNKPSIAVTDWLIPDTTPSRYASVPMNYVIKCTKAALREQVEHFLSAPEQYQSIFDNGKELFSNSGHCCSDIMDAIAYFTDNSSGCREFLNKRLSSQYAICSMWN